MSLYAARAVAAPFTQTHPHNASRCWSHLPVLLVVPSLPPWRIHGHRHYGSLHSAKILVPLTLPSLPPSERRIALAEGRNGEDVISILRSGSAAVNAAAKMKERGYTNRCRSRHRLTPGTVKFAAFMCSLEGSKGLTILEVAEKIQKSGLRDLTTSKTPEASISAALSRDSSFLKELHLQHTEKDAKTPLVRAQDGGVLSAVSDINKETNNVVSALTPPLIHTKSHESGSLRLLNKSNAVRTTSDPPVEVSSDYHEVAAESVQDTEIDESNQGESWVQGLAEGDYCDLSVEERLNALVALIGVATEGNSIRGILEERLEAASALKKQMWAESQLDKRRSREEFLVKCNMILSQLNAVSLVHERNGVKQEFSVNPENLSGQQYASSEKTRSQLKSYIGHKAEQLHVYRSLPLGQDRRRNRYWQFSTSASPNDPGSGRIFFESRDEYWRLIDSIEAFDALLSSLDTRDSFKIQLGRNDLEKIAISKRAHVFCEEKWRINPNWKMQISDNSVPIGLRLLKLLLATIEASVPAEALEPFWTDVYRKSWGVKLYSTSSTEEVFEMLTILEGAIRQGFLSSDFETTADLLSSNMQDLASDKNLVARSGSAAVLPWVPDTTAAVALRLLDLDSAISYTLHQKVGSSKEQGTPEFMKLPPRYTPCQGQTRN
ncbi:hypothetical protein GUJ93_ZPchr0005g15652 [Zizania palustris]|uniref:Uncharacterized protein n=1 Tax=Zizania palustris TaxID=103762 RepID=A0A8J5T5R4_ZIZPA|nr:hypothetical protein GUJ93_ZPchr0005g15652 [Zizania palustris]